MNFARSFWSTVVLALAATSVSAFSARSAAISRPVWTRAPVSRVALFSESVEGAAGISSAEAAGLTIETVEMNSELKGKVKTITEFGVFVDVGLSSDGLVHKSQLSDTFVANVEDLGFEPGQEVTVRVIKVDVEKGQLSLSMKSKDAPDAPRRGGGRTAQDLSVYEAADISTEMDATVEGITDFGAFVKFADGVQGLVHISQLSEGRVESVGDAVKMGDAVKVRVLGVDSGKLSLSMKAYVEGEVAPAKRTRRERGGGDDENPRTRAPRIDNIWADNTEPKWAEIQSETNQGKVQYDNMLELKL